MCGIVGYVGYKSVIPILIKGLEHLEYRGYDSAGIAYLRHDHRLCIVKEKGKVSQLKAGFKNSYPSSYIGIGHTRWATHGEPSTENAHPHYDYANRVALVHNGIVENYLTLKEELLQKGISFSSETDTEVAANLMGYYYEKGNLLDAFCRALKRLRGFFAFVLISEKEPDKLLVFKRSNPLVIGLGDHENFVASDVPAFLSHTQKVLYLEDDDYAIITADHVDVFSLKTGKKVYRKPMKIQWNILEAKKGGYAHFMLKEIEEQPAVFKNTFSYLVSPQGNIHFEKIDSKIDSKLKKINKIFLVSCGTAYHAALVGGYMLEECTRIACEAQFSSEFRYRNPVIGEYDLVILITQSGETADTLAALREAKSKGAFTLAIVNVVGSTIARESDSVIYTQAGPEIGVASTKAYTAQLMTLAIFALYYARLKGAMSYKQILKLFNELKKIPHFADRVLRQKKKIEKCAKKYSLCRNFLYLGRSYNYPNALEGALKLKEISYAHAHGYAAGEMKHGPIALIDSSQPVICIAPESQTYEKMISNIEEIRARGGIVITIGTEGDNALEKLSDHFFSIPAVSPILSPLLTVLPLQFFAYQVALLNKRDVDRPRNLAKSVTVE